MVTRGVSNTSPFSYTQIEPSFWPIKMRPSGTKANVVGRKRPSAMTSVTNPSLWEVTTSIFKRAIAPPSCS